MDIFSKEKVLSQLSTLISERVEKHRARSVDTFAHDYFKFATERDLGHQALDETYGSLLSHWNFAQRRLPGQAIIRVFNPTLEEHGWQSPHTVVEIIVEDLPFLVQSITMELNRLGLNTYQFIHPVLEVSRLDNGMLCSYPSTVPSASNDESFIHIQVDHQSDKSKIVELTNRLNLVIDHVRAANDDWYLCRDKINSACQDLSKVKTANSKQQIDEAIAFLKWLLDGNFVLLGYRQYEIAKHGNEYGLKEVANSGLGVLRSSLNPSNASKFALLSADAYSLISQATPLLITKATTRSVVHRAVFMNYIGVKRFDLKGKVIGEMRFLGLFSASAYRTPLEEIPLIKTKVERVFKLAGFSDNSHNGKALLHVMDEMPRDEVLHSTDAEFYRCAMGILMLNERQRVRVFVRHDVYGQFVSSLVYVPRESFHTDNRKKIQKILLETFKGESAEIQVQLSESMLARIHFIIHVRECCAVEFDVNEIEAKIIEAIHDWKDGLKDALTNHFGEEKGGALYAAFADGLSAAYREDHMPKQAVLDLEHLDAIQDRGFRIMLYRPLELEGQRFRFKLYCQGMPAPLSETLPMLEHLGVIVCDEKPYEITNESTGTKFWIDDFGVSYHVEDDINLESIKPVFQDAFERIWYGHIESDGFNRLVIKAGLDWKSISLFRAFYFYLRQTGMGFSQNYVESTLENNPAVVELLLKCFDARLNPQNFDQQTVDSTVKEITENIDQVSSLDQDRILRHYLNLVLAILRTNYYQDQIDDKGVPYFSFKFDPSMVDGLPSPRPRYEIFVYSPRVEGVHMRGGNIARGGLRWSDRKEDFRTEILGLLKAQMTKNSVIVPTGAKGGFVAKQLDESGSREEIHREVLGCYRVFIQGLLDITDNLVKNKIKKPTNVVCHDGDDPYLVVAADKGTATFSDTANSIAEEYQFWLGDAFASGGSIGYDHKKMGITARGAWESVKYHFSERQLDVDTTPFTVVGIGDMSGDVFGNGVLLSTQIKLLGAFNHQHIFLDPDPDPKQSFDERKRLFEMPRSTWMDYDKKLISKGGGVYERQSKSIKLTEPVKKVFGIEANQITPNELIRRILTAPVDLLWNGGIGTYVKSGSERHGDVGDRSNDSIRIDATELRCKVIGEGGNLGLTQHGRIEFAKLGGGINTDSVDNSAGVDCSDHEVNIKILLNQIITQGEITEIQRNRLLESMTEEVARLVLKNNYLQARAIGLIEEQSGELSTLHKRIITRLERDARLDRSLEGLANDEEMDERKAVGKGLVRPEVCVFIAYSKMLLKETLLSSYDEFDLELMERELLGYFPEVLRKSYRNEIRKHHLSREIFVNSIVNNMVNRLGAAFPFRLMDETGGSVADTVTDFRYACDIYGISELWEEIESLNTIDLATTQEMMVDLRRLLERTMFWLQNYHCGIQNKKEVYTDLITGMGQVSADILKFLPEFDRGVIEKRSKNLTEKNVPKNVAYKIGNLNGLFSCLDVIAVSRDCQRSIRDLSKIFFKVDEKLDLNQLRFKINCLPRDDYWQSLARTSVRDDFHKACRSLLKQAVVSKNRNTDKVVEVWWEKNQAPIARYQRIIGEFHQEGEQKLEKITVAVKALQAITQMT